MCCDYNIDKWCQKCCWMIVEDWRKHSFTYDSRDVLHELNHIVTLYISLGGISIDEVQLSDMFEFIMIKYKNRVV